MKSNSHILTICAIALAVGLGTTVAFGAERADYLNATLVRAESCQDNCTRIVVQAGEVVYVAVQNANFHWQAYSASEFEENGPVEVRIDGSKLFLKRPNGKELKTKIVKRVRIGANGQAKLEALLGARTAADDQRANSDIRTRGTGW